MRIVKEAEIRKTEILDATERLFGEKGFDGTTTADILEAVGIARGTLYYHFKTKEDILDSLIDRLAERMFSAASLAASDKSLPLVERILRVLMSVNVSDKGGGVLIEQLHKPQNALMHQKSKRVVLGGLTPVLAGLAEEGTKSGLFSTPYPYECMELAVAYMNEAFEDESAAAGEKDLARRVEAFVFNLERVLGAAPGSFSVIARAYAGERE